VGSRGPLLHDATVPSLDVMFDPARQTEGYTNTLHGATRIPGHSYGLSLSASDRADLVSYLSQL
jgi:hypothetical protein